MKNSDQSGQARPLTTLPDEHSALQALISAGAVSTVFQPIVSLELGEVAAFEALSRPGPATSFANAGELFDAAERQNCQWPLEALTRQTALDAAARWPAGQLLFLNTSPQVFADRRFASEIVRAVRATPGLTPSRVVLEITERSDQQYVAGLEEQVRLVKTHGFQVAIDDVGAGASGLVRIMALRPQWLKLDRDLIAGIDRDRVRQNLIRFFVHFARLSGVKLIAEGIEHEAELATLIDLGLSYAQGFFLGRPGSLDQTLSPQLSAWARERWSAAERINYRDPRQTAVGKLARPATTVEASRKVIEVAAGLIRDRSAAGIVIMDKGRVVGWCERDKVLRAASDARANQAVGFLVGSDATVTPAHAPVSEALELASGRDDEAAVTPLVVLDGGNVTGVVPVGDLLHAAALAARTTQSRTSSLTGLPGRVHADEHLRTLLKDADIESDSHRVHCGHDCAFIDIREFGAYNAGFGYDLGDQLLRRLAGLVQAVVVSGDRGTFLAHVGDDRFIVTAPHGVLAPRLLQLAERFDSAETARVTEAPGSPLLAGLLTRPCLRILLAEHIENWATSPQDLARRGDEMRRRDAHNAVRITHSTLKRIAPAPASESSRDRGTARSA